jgi:hypothetical protein
MQMANMKATADVTEWDIQATNAMLNNVFTVSVGLINLIGTQKIADVDDVHITKLLKIELDKIPPAQYILIEHQPAKIGMKSNNNALAISRMIGYHYCAGDIRFVSPHLKNNVSIGGCVMEQHTTDNKKYRARKVHSVNNFKAFCKMYNITIQMPKKCDDIADAFTQAYAFVKLHGVLTL